MAEHSGVLVVLLALALLPLAAPQPGFTSIDCGSSSDHSDQETGILWQTDRSNIFTGTEASVAANVASTVPKWMQTLRFFPAATAPAKNCYVLLLPEPFEPAIYLIRAGFFYGNYDSLQAAAIKFQISVGSTPWADVDMDTGSDAPLYYEAITALFPYTSLSVCLIRTDESSTPFINSLEFRLLSPLTYTQDLPGANLYLVSRANFGERMKTYRYPDDPFDRIWPPYVQVFPELGSLVVDVSTTHNITDDPDTTRDDPPNIVMQTAITAPSITFTVPLPSTSRVLYSFVCVAELNGSLPSNASRIEDLVENGVSSGSISLTPNYPPFHALEFGSSTLPVDGSLTAQKTLMRNSVSTLDPLVSSNEVYLVQTVAAETNSDDVNDLLNIKSDLNLTQWAGDPCLPIPWDELVCSADGTVTSLNLSSKNRSGPIPTRIADLTNLTMLDLSDNDFSGTILDLSHLTSLTSINISNNRLTGVFPSWLEQLPQLVQLDVSNNYLRGDIPASFIDQLGSGFRYSSNSQLQCVPVPNAVCPPSPPGPAPSGLPVGHSSKSSSRPVIIGVAAVLIIFVIGGVVTWFCCCWPTKKGAQPRGSVVLYSTKIKTRPFSLYDVQKATNNYERQLGMGGFGPVYYGTLADKREVAVKVMSRNRHQGMSEYLNEIDLLTFVNHTNLVSLIGYCQEAEQLILLYEFMGGGDLGERLHGPDAVLVHPLPWQKRLEVALDAAKGLEYLHHGCRPSIVHRDVKSSNILLSNNLVAKVADFGFSRFTSETGSEQITRVVGTQGYLDPEYGTSGVLSEKSDVYSFGVVLLEILTGEKAYSMHLQPEARQLVTRVRSVVESRSLENVLDPTLARGSYRMEAAWMLVDLAMRCVASRASLRPDMVRVVRVLTRIKDIEAGYDKQTGDWEQNQFATSTYSLDFSASTSFASTSSNLTH